MEQSHSTGRWVKVSNLSDPASWTELRPSPPKPYRRGLPEGPTGGACRASWSCFQTAACPWSVSRWGFSPPSARRKAARWRTTRRCGGKAGGAGASRSGWAGWDTDSSHTPLAHTGISPADPPRGPRQTAHKHLHAGRNSETGHEPEDEGYRRGSHHAAQFPFQSALICTTNGPHSKSLFYSKRVSASSDRHRLEIQPSTVSMIMTDLWS